MHTISDGNVAIEKGATIYYAQQTVITVILTRLYSEGSNSTKAPALSPRLHLDGSAVAPPVESKYIV